MQGKTISSLCLLAEAGLPQECSCAMYIVLGLAIAFTSTSTLLASHVCHWCSTPNRKPEGVSSAPSDPGGGGLTAENEVFPSHRLKLLSSVVISEGTSSRDPYNPVLLMKICVDFFLAASGLCSSMGDPHCSLGCGSGSSAHARSCCSMWGLVSSGHMGS